jgi:hypothetical protein
MTSRQAIAESRRAHELNGTRWPVPLLNYFDGSPDDGRAFDWLCSCVGELLNHLGKASAELTEAVSWARRQAADGPDNEAVERMASGLWSRRSPEQPEITAVAQLLFALSRSDRSQHISFAGACSAPICLLERLESERGEVLDRVISHFSRYVEGRDT